MLVPDNVHPEQTVYFNGAYVLRAIQRHRLMEIVDLYFETISQRQMSLPMFILCLDWLFLIDLVTLDDHGKVILCS